MKLLCCQVPCSRTNSQCQLYGLFKQGENKVAFEKAPKPGMFDLVVRLPLLPYLIRQTFADSARTSREKKSTRPGRQLWTLASLRRMRKQSTLH